MVLSNHIKRTFVWIVLASALLALSGCGLGYAFHQGVYQIRLLSQKRPVDEVLEDPTVEPEIKERIQLVQRVKSFGEDHLDLRSSGGYKTYIEIDGSFVAYLVSASPRDRLVAYHWRFPLVGSFPYKGFFKLEDAKAEILAQKGRGYDTHLSGAVAFSALGWFSDPLYSSMLRMNEIDLVYTILHEMVHGTVFFPDHVDFNEQLATFVGWRGTIAFMEKVYGTDSSRARLAHLAVENAKLLGKFLDRAYEKLTRYYSLPLGFEEKLAGRQEVFDEIEEEFQRHFEISENPRIPALDDIVWNNASLLAFWRYRYDTGALEALYTQMRHDLKAMMALMVAWYKNGQNPQIALTRIIHEE